MMLDPGCRLMPWYTELQVLLCKGGKEKTE